MNRSGRIRPPWTQSGAQRTPSGLEDLIVSLAHPTSLQIAPDGNRVAYVADPYSQDGEHPPEAFGSHRWTVPHPHSS